MSLTDKYQGDQPEKITSIEVTGCTRTWLHQKFALARPALDIEWSGQNTKYEDLINHLKQYKARFNNDFFTNAIDWVNYQDDPLAGTFLSALHNASDVEELRGTIVSDGRIGLFLKKGKRVILEEGSAVWSFAEEASGSTVNYGAVDVYGIEAYSGVHVNAGYVNKWPSLLEKQILVDIGQTFRKRVTYAAIEKELQDAHFRCRIPFYQKNICHVDETSESEVYIFDGTAPARVFLHFDDAEWPTRVLYVAGAPRNLHVSRTTYDEDGGAVIKKIKTEAEVQREVPAQFATLEQALAAAMPRGTAEELLKRDFATLRTAVHQAALPLVERYKSWV